MKLTCTSLHKSLQFLRLELWTQATPWRLIIFVPLKKWHKRAGKNPFSKKISMNIPLNPKFSWLNSRWAAFPDPPVRWLWLLLAWAFREGWTKELMNGDRWCWSYLEKPQNWMNKYQNVEHLNVWWVKNDSIYLMISLQIGPIGTSFLSFFSVTCSSSSECGLVFSVCLIIGRNGKFSHYKPEANSQLSRLKTRAHASATCSARDTRGVEPWHWTVLRE